MVAVPAWLVARQLGYWWFAVLAIVLVVGWWRRLNAPDAKPFVQPPPTVEVPREAWLGLVGGIGFAALMLVFIAALA